MPFDIFTIASWMGSISFAFSGFLVGIRKELDVMGIFILAMLTANGGGAVRDILVGRTPSVLTDISAFLLVLAVIGTALLFRLHRKPTLERSSLFVLCDSLGLVAFSVTGAMVGVEAGLHVFGVMVLAFITATGGGIIRDAIVSDVPAVLSSDFYGSIALLLGASIYAIEPMNLPQQTSITLMFLAALILRLIAYLRGWHLPRIQL